MATAELVTFKDALEKAVAEREEKAASEAVATQKLTEQGEALAVEKVLAVAVAVAVAAAPSVLAAVGGWLAAAMRAVRRTSAGSRCRRVARAAFARLVRPARGAAMPFVFRLPTSLPTVAFSLYRYF